MIDQCNHVIDQWSHVILCSMAVMLLKDNHLKLHMINLEVQSIFLVFFPTSFVASGNCVVVLLHPPVSQVLLWSLKQSGPQLQPVHNQLHPPAPVSCDIESGGCGLCMRGCGQLVGLASLTSKGTGSINYNFCV